ncbi:MAG: helix-turn-helix transcriptional regulator [Anaerovibrio sp.]|nr:helix-turn-helix transcriptional regulator [Anaerovibrio sp.]
MYFFFFDGDDRVEIDGNSYNLITPTTPAELSKALNLVTILVEAHIVAKSQEEKERLDGLIFRQKKLNAEFLKKLGDFDDTILIKNLKHLMEESGLRIAQLEDILQLSKGYISRIANNKTNKRMSVDALWKISKLFGISMQTLVTNDLAKMTDSELYILRLVEKISAESRDRKLFWQKGCDYIGDYDMESDSYSYPYIVQSDKYEYVDSNFRCFSAKLNEKLSVCVANVSYKRGEDGCKVDSYELWLGNLETGTKEGICSTLTLEPSIASVVYELVNLIEDSMCSTALSRNALELIKSYI